jgi:transcriptional regulator with XRE-family HTH domain
MNVLEHTAVGATIPTMPRETEVYFRPISIQKLLKKRGIANAVEFAAAAGISYPTALAWWRGDKMGRIDAKLLNTVAKYLEEDWRKLVSLIEEA